MKPTIKKTTFRELLRITKNNNILIKKIKITKRYILKYILNIKIETYLNEFTPN